MNKIAKAKKETDKQREHEQQKKNGNRALKFYFDVDKKVTKG